LRMEAMMKITSLGSRFCQKKVRGRPAGEAGHQRNQDEQEHQPRKAAHGFSANLVRG
jgi:hypothetical protein